MSITCVLWDLDGTLLNTQEIMLVSYRETLMCSGILDVSKEQLIPHLNDSPPSVLRRFGAHSANKYWENYTHNIPFHLKLYDSRLKEKLLALQSWGISIGVVTSLRKGISESLLKAAGIFDLLDTLVAYGDARPHKPAPHPILKAMEKLSVSAKNTIYIGDRESDILAGKRASVLTGAPLWSAKKRDFSGCIPDYYFPTFDGLLKIVKNTRD